MWVKAVGRKLWMAMALAVPSRLWLGGVVSRHRDGKLIAAVVRVVRSCARSLALLVCVDGLASYVTAFVKGFRHRRPRDGRPGRPQRLVEPGLLIGQVIKRYSGRRVVGVTRRVVRGSAAAIAAVLARTGTGTGINTAYIERLNATFRSRWTPLVRRGRTLAMAAGLTDHRWGLREVLGERLPPERWKAPRRKPRRLRHTSTTVAPPLAA